jgi:hypothetical protein
MRRQMAPEHVLALGPPTWARSLNSPQPSLSHNTSLTHEVVTHVITIGNGQLATVIVGPGYKCRNYCPCV